MALDITSVLGHSRSFGPSPRIPAR